MIFIEIESAVVIANIQIDKKYEKFNVFEQFEKATR